MDIGLEKKNEGREKLTGREERKKENGEGESIIRERKDEGGRKITNISLPFRGITENSY